MTRLSTKIHMGLSKRLRVKFKMFSKWTSRFERGRLSAFKECLWAGDINISVRSDLGRHLLSITDYKIQQKIGIQFCG